ncbi:MAG: hypothetical protein P4L22_05175 [Candidatus Babeliales bacterium]|nr:hypothetical protein [Candidatus Babeliales bacterium]
MIVSKKYLLLATLFCFKIMPMEQNATIALPNQQGSIVISSKDYNKILEVQTKRQEALDHIERLEQRMLKYLLLIIGFKKSKLITEQVNYDIAAYTICVKNINNKLIQLYKERDSLPSFNTMVMKHIKTSLEGTPNEIY